MRTRKHVAGLAGLILLALAVPAASPAAHSAQHTIQVGAINPGNSLSSYNYTRFYPERLEIHSGDTVKWRWGAAGYFGWHTVSFIPVDMDVSTYPAGAEGAIPDAFRADETGVALNEPFVFGHAGSPSGASPCGRGPWRNLPAQPICTLSDSSQFLSSSLSDTFLNMPGAPQNVEWTVKVDLEPGSYRFRCLIHPPMTGQLDVVPDSDPLDPPANIASLIEQDTRAADLKVAELESRDPYDPTTGKWRVVVGAETDDGHVALYSYFPQDLKIPAGEQVEFVAEMDEPNTATFPPDAHGTFGPPHQGCTPSKCGQGSGPDGQLPGAGLGFVAFPFVCDIDDPRTGTPGLPTFLTRATWSCGEGNLEWLVAPHMAQSQRAPADAVATRATYHNSGALIAEKAPTWYRGPFEDDIAPIPARFEAAFPNPGEFPYACLAHPDFMKGSVVVGA